MKKKDTKDTVRRWVRRAILALRRGIHLVLNPRFLLCFGLAWMVTNGWAYVLLALGTLFEIPSLAAVAGAYMALLWLPFTPEKLLTLGLAILLLRWLFPQDARTLGRLRAMLAAAKRKLKKRRAQEPE